MTLPNQMTKTIQRASSDELLKIFIDSGALLSGHFLLSSGLHSPSYLEKFQVLQYPKYVETLCEQIALRFADEAVDVVVGPTTGGVLLAYEVGKQLGVRGIFAERENEASNTRVLRRGFAIEPGSQVLVVDDIFTTGGSVIETVKAVRNAGGNVFAVAVLADRSPAPVDLGIRLEALIKLDVEAYAPDKCPLCAQGIPVTKPGTTPKPQ
jgi:orotate phosphoribosyltransferase